MNLWNRKELSYRQSEELIIRRTKKFGANKFFVIFIVNQIENEFILRINNWNSDDLAIQIEILRTDCQA